MSVTKSQVNKAGQVLRKHLRHEIDEPERVDWAIDVLLSYRATFQQPLTTAGMGLRSVVASTRCARVEVSQRLKRVPTIIDKLSREPTLQLANMQDIGGCRAILDSIDEVRRVQARLRKNRPGGRVNDYIEHPKASGYRGVHVIVEYHGHQIEIQLRTRVMHEWAITVERLSGRIGTDFKSGLGSAEVRALLATISEAMATEEMGMIVTQELLDRMTTLRTRALPYLS